ncbi:MAG TPA: hypothetical protein VEG08_15830, partial [Terriglobales bacterium]|nr:hypothetical protein [Terriglobales bacterium]
MANPQQPWQHAPLRAKVLFLAGVFFLFSSIGFIGDILAMGKEPWARLILTVALSGGFAILYAVAGFRLRGRAWVAMVPIFLLQFLFTGLIANRFPSQAAPRQMGPAEISALDYRLGIDGFGVIVVMVGGYVCFLYFAITEGRRHFRVQAEMELAAEIHKGLVPP